MTRARIPSIRTSGPSLGLSVAAVSLLLVLSSASFGAPPEREGPNVVTIDAYAASGDRTPATPRQRSLGFVVEADGFLLTVYEGLVDPRSGRLLGDLRVTVRETGERMSASIVGVEPTIGIAVLKVEPEQPLRLTAVDREWGLEVGSDIFAPTSLDGGDLAPAHGRIAGLNTRECYQESLTSTMFRAELPVPDTARGAPVYTASGGVIGLYTAYRPTAEEGHAEDDAEVHVLPIALPFNIYDSIKQKKSLRSPWTGFSVRRLEAAEQKQWFPTKRGHRAGIGIEYVWKDSPAEKLGVERGDILIQMGHNRVTSVADFQKWLYLYGVGADLKLVFLRNGEYLIADTTIEERPSWATPR